MYSKKKREEFLELYEKNACNVHRTCQKFGINRTTFYNWKNSDEEFKEGIEEADEGLIDDTESSLYHNITWGNVTAQIYFLKTKGKKRGWGEDGDVLVQTDSNIDLSQLTVDELKVYIDLQKKAQKVN